MTPAPISVERLRELLAKATPGPWMLATSCSWRRILSVRGESVIEPITQRHDNHPDISCGTDYVNAELAVEAVNALPALLQQLAETKGQSDRLCGKYLAALSRAEAAESKLAERDAEVAKWRERSEANERVRIEMMDRFNEAASDLRAAERRASDYQRKCAQLSDMLFGTPCADIRWQQEREHLVARAEAAERAREEACGLLRDVWNRDGGKECRCINISRDTEREYENGHCPHQRIAAFLAASGGSHEPR